MRQDRITLVRVVQQHNVIGNTHNQAERYRRIAGDLLQFSLAFLATLLLETFQSRDCDGQKLDNNGSIDIRLNGQREYRCGGEYRTGHCIVQTQDCVTQIIIKGLSQNLNVHKGNRDAVANSVNDKDQKCEQ